MADHRGEEQVLDLLAQALREQEVPAAIREAGYAAYAWRTIDLELASLVYDSTHDGLALAGTRSEQAVLRALTFEGDSVTIELEVTPEALLGQVVPAEQRDIGVALRSGGSRSVSVDEVGCFTVAPVPEEAFRLEVRGERGVATDWITL